MRILSKIIKASYHLKNVLQEETPAMIVKITRTLSSIIKPSSPSRKTIDFIAGNAKNWEFTSLLILKDHYTEVIDIEIAKLLLTRSNLEAAL